MKSAGVLGKNSSCIPHVRYRRLRRSFAAFVSLWLKNSVSVRDWAAVLHHAQEGA
jgi:hypothetical protein